MGTKLKKILIVEDETSLIQVLEDKFVKEGFKVLLATDGGKGFDMATKNKPDIILLDIVMPKMDGMTMLKKLRQNKWGAKVPVILLTNLNDADKVTEGVEHGVYDFLVKSNWKIGDIVKKVKDKLK